MTVAINYEAESKIVESDADGRLHLVPFDQLHESERAILENRQFYEDTKTGLGDFVSGESTSSNWLFDDE